MYTHSFNFWLREKLSYTVNIGNDCLCDIIHGLIVTNIVCILPSGGAGGLGGRGIKCHEYTTWMDPFQKYCTDKGLTGRASRGQPGPSGASEKVTFIVIHPHFSLRFRFHPNLSLWFSHLTKKWFCTKFAYGKYVTEKIVDVRFGCKLAGKCDI